ncbi:ABC transporter permease [Gemmata sp. JC673]|uniref:ABC transporter permease n=1 Tax=Gemmata algarum TaxID=2975278 RepID=A0ABU5F2J8_9BACT|nr:ABC transporter permease [Gemmata algarum]MDY3561424.1 ABC transporter permease [Gemmata algarum]
MTRLLGVLGLVAALYVALFLSDDKAGTPGNLIAVASYQGQYGVITLGAALVIITGGIDLSIGSVVACGAFLFGTLVNRGVHPYAAVPVVVLFGACAGAANGLLVTRMRLQPFLVTLCGMFIFRGAARLIGSTVSLKNAAELHPEFNGPLRTLRYLLIGKTPADGELVFPAQFALLLVLAAAVGFFLHRSAYGRYWYAIGHSELAAKYAGVNVNRSRLAVYVLCSALAALAGVLLFLDAPSVQSNNAGLGWELYAILGAVLGGCSLRGGEGTAVGIVLGAMVLPIIESIVTFRGAESDVIPAVVGVTLLVGTVVDELIRRRSRVHR